MADTVESRSHTGVLSTLKQELTCSSSYIPQQRNKPKEAPKQPEKAPFFLPILPGVEHRFAVTQTDETPGQKKKTSKRLELGATQADSTFLRKLASEDPEGNCGSSTFLITELSCL